jgi:hypothetical protein
MEDVEIALFNQARFNPPQIPSQRRIVDTVARDMRGEVEK